MAKLAPVQALSHGHPMTSGFPRDVMNYYISWGAAEIDTAESHYTEQLVLLPSNELHQYYETITNNGYSRSDGLSYEEHMSRELFDIPSHGHWYLCMQKSFKFQPEFDNMLCNILQQDPHGRHILHQPDHSQHTFDTIVNRLAYAGCDFDRIHFVPVQPHHKLLALYSVSDVILDSYPAGGCTTTREILEMHKPVV